MALELLGPVGVYFVAKYLPYVAWCGLGLWWLREPPAVRVGSAAALGALRLVVGFGLGWLVVFGLAAVAPGQGRLGFSPILLLPALALLRWLEWSAVSMLGRGSWRGWLIGATTRDNLWRIGGLVVSFTSDALVVLAIGVMGWVPC